MILVDLFSKDEDEDGDVRQMSDKRLIISEQ